MKLSEALEGYYIAMQAEGKSDATIDIYKVMHRHLIKFVGDAPPETITTKQLRDFIVWLKSDYKNAHTGEPVSTSYLANAWKSIRSFFFWASLEFEMERPDLNLKMPRSAHRLVKPFSEKDIGLILQACAYSRKYTMPNGKTFRVRNSAHKRNVALILVLLDSGLRVGEVSRLNVSDLNIELGEITVSPFGKGQKSTPRHVYIGSRTKKSLWGYLQTRDSLSEADPLFISSLQNRRMSRFTIGKALRDVGKRADVQKVHPHRFRHTFAIQYLRNGGDVFTLQRLLGHSSLEMVKRYLTLADTDARAAHQKASPVDRMAW